MSSVSPVLRVLPLSFPWQTADPFLFCVYHRDHYPRAAPGSLGPDPALLRGRNLGMDFQPRPGGFRMYHGRRVPGFPQHPHCGFETVTIVTQGTCDHSDSLGGRARFGGPGGDAQWMTAGRGCQHAEMFPLLSEEEENPLELFQIWLNLPRASKGCEPAYTMLWGEDNTRASFSPGSSALIIAGSLNGVSASTPPPPDSWAADPANDVAIAIVDMEPGSSFQLAPASAATSRRVYLFEGDELRVAEQALQVQHAAELRPLQEVRLSNEGDVRARMLVLQGRAIAEPVAQQGPFVGNTQQDIAQAIQNYQRTQFGGWPYETSDPVHPKDAGRFAVHPDGRKEQK